MLESNFNVIAKDVNVQLKDAQVQFQCAAAMTGDMADEMRKRAVSLIDTAIARTKELQNSAITSSEVAALLTKDALN